MGLEHNVEVDGGTSGRGTEGLPVRWDIIPGVLDTYMIPILCEGLCDIVERRGKQDAENGELGVPHS